MNIVRRLDQSASHGSRVQPENFVLMKTLHTLIMYVLVSFRASLGQASFKSSQEFDPNHFRTRIERRVIGTSLLLQFLV